MGLRSDSHRCTKIWTAGREISIQVKDTIDKKMIIIQT